MKEPKVEVGILFEPQIEFILLAPYHVSGKDGVADADSLIEAAETIKLYLLHLAYYGGCSEQTVRIERATISG